MSLDNLFDQAATMARVQAEGYRQVREQARREALEEAAALVDRIDTFGRPDVAEAISQTIRALK